MKAKKRPKSVPAPRVRRHGTGFRGVATILGKRAYGPTYATVEEAQAWLQSLDRIGPGAGEPLTIESGMQLLERDLADTGAAAGTVAFYRRAQLELATIFGDDTRLDELGESAIRFYIDKRKRRGVAMRTIVNKELGTLRRIIKLAMASGRLGRDPLAGVKMPKVRGGRFDVIAAADVAKAIATIRAKNADHADIVELVWRTSMRRAEVARLTVADIDLANRRLFVRGKTVNRYRPIGEALVPVLERMIARAESDGRLVSSLRKIEKLFDWWRGKLGLDAFSPHVLRHGFASDLLNRGVGESVVASLMGHSSTRMLARYFHAQDAALRAAVDQLGTEPPHQQPSPSDATAKGRRARRS
jgi:integrase/recombinase XerD